MKLNMVDSVPVNHISLGLSSKLHVFKVFDNLCDSEKSTNNKDIWSKPNSKPSVFDALEYMKTIPNNDSTSSDDKKLSKKSKPKKLCILKDCKRDYSISFFASAVSTKAKTTNWFTKRKFSPVENIEYPATVETKQIKLEWSEESEIVFISPDSFYQACKSIRIDKQKINFRLYFKDSWHEMELQANHIRNITVYKNRPLLSLSMKPLVIGEIQHIADDIEIYASSPISLHPRKASAVKELAVFFLKRPVSAHGVDLLQTLLSSERVFYNESDIDTKDLLKNMFDALPQLVDPLLETRPLTWNALWGEFCVPPPPLPAVNTPKKISLSISKSPRDAGQMMKSLPANSVAGIVLHPQIPGTSGISVTNGPPRPLLGPATAVPSTVTTAGFITNHIVIATNRLGTDPYPNLFNRMIHDPTAAIGQLSVHVNSLNAAAAAASNSFQISFPTVFQGVRPSHPGDQLIAGNAVNPGGQPIAVAVVPTDPNVPLHYVPGRHIGNIFESFNYAPSPEHNVLVHGSDLVCLNPGQYLNDNIINFYLNYIRYELVTEQQRQRSHLFNVFFNTKLQGAQSSLMNETPEMRHARVAKWTKKVDIFDKDFIFVPINEAQHWFLAVICFPWMAGMLSYDELFGLANATANQPPSEIPENHSEFATITRVKRAERLREDLKVDPKPCILLFDSLQHQSRAPNVRLIREYLRTEWDAKRRARDGPLVFDKNTIRGFNPQVPQQSNNIDCGIYVLHYVENFFADPLTKFTKEYFQSSLSHWFEKKKVDQKRSFIQNLLLKKGEAAQQHPDKHAGALKVTRDDSAGPDLQIL